MTDAIAGCAPATRILCPRSVATLCSLDEAVVAVARDRPTRSAACRPVGCPPGSLAGAVLAGEHAGTQREEGRNAMPSRSHAGMTSSSGSRSSRLKRFWTLAKRGQERSSLSVSAASSWGQKLLQPTSADLAGGESSPARPAPRSGPSRRTPAAGRGRCGPSAADAASPRPPFDPVGPGALSAGSPSNGAANFDAITTRVAPTPASAEDVSDAPRPP